MIDIFSDPEFPSLKRPVRVKDFVVNKIKLNDVVKCSVGVVRETSANDCKVFFIGKGKEITTAINNIVPIDIYKTGKPKETHLQPYKYKICNICHILKNQADEFEYNQNDKYGRQTTRPSCKDCRVDINGAAMPRSEKLRMESIKPKDWELFECPICHKRSIPGVTCNIVIDHDHRTGKARAWICDSCNTGIGRFQDDPSILKDIIAYIEKNLEKGVAKPSDSLF